MGGPNKLLLPWHGETVLRAVVDTLLFCELEVVVVTGRDADEVAEEVPPARTVFNPDFAEGLGRSIAVGVEVCRPGIPILIALGDMPRLDPEVVLSIVARWQQEPDDAIIAPVYSAEPDRHGHPVLFGPPYRDALLALSGDEGARSIVKANHERLVTIAVEGSLTGIEVPADIEP